MSRSVAGNPVVTLHAPENVLLGEPVPITIRLENKREEPLELYLRGREATCDIVVTANDGRVVWRRLEGEIVPAIIRLEVLAPGEIVELRDSWDQRDKGGKPAGPGSYTIRGTVLTDGSSTLESPAITLRLRPK
jgi:hypothetical protein